VLQPAGADPVGALFVFLDLLERQPERVPELLLAHAQHHPPHPNACADMFIGRVWRLATVRHLTPAPKSSQV
jgi:hypothetical protein